MDSYKILKGLLLCALAVMPASPVFAQHKGLFLQPDFGVGFTRNYYDAGTLLGEFRKPGFFNRPALALGYMWRPGIGVTAGIGYGDYSYTVVMPYIYKVNYKDHYNDTVIAQRQ